MTSGRHTLLRHDESFSRQPLDLCTPPATPKQTKLLSHTLSFMCLLLVLFYSIIYCFSLSLSLSFPLPLAHWFLSFLRFVAVINPFSGLRGYDTVDTQLVAMVSEVSSQLVNEVNVGAPNSLGRNFSNKKKRVPRKVHKAEREKLKRDYLNELFLELGSALDPTRQNNGKASILGDATRLLRELLSQVQCLKRENVALLSESHYIAVEKNELKDENAALEAQIVELHSQLREGSPHDPTWSKAAAQARNANLSSSMAEDSLQLPVADPVLQVPPVVGPLLVIPLHHDFHSAPDPGTVQIPSNVKRPHARYPTPADSWPSQLLGEQNQTDRCQPDNKGNGKE